MAEKTLQTSAFDELIVTKKKGSIKVYFRDAIPDSLVRVVTKINNVIKFYETAADPALVDIARIVNGELVLTAPPNNGDEVIFFTKEHSVFFPDNGKRFSPSMFIDTWQTGDHEYGFCNFDEVDLSLDDAITMRVNAGVFSGRIVANGQEKQWLDIGENPVSNVIPQSTLDYLKLNPVKGHLFDIQAQLRNVGNVHYFLSGKIQERSVEVLQYYGLNNQNNVTVSNVAMHGVFICRTQNNVRSQMRIGCLNMSNETEDIEIYQPKIFENVNDITCQTTGNILGAVFIPYEFNGKLNTRDCKYFKATVQTSRRGKIKIYKSPDPSYLKKGVGGITPLVNSLVADGGDWSPVPGSSLWYIDNSQVGSTAPRLITAFDETNSEKVDGGGGGTAAAGESIKMEFPDPELMPLKGTHGEVYVIEGYGVGNTADMRIDVLFIGEGV